MAKKKRENVKERANFLMVANALLRWLKFVVIDSPDENGGGRHHPGSGKNITKAESHGSSQYVQRMMVISMWLK